MEQSVQVIAMGDHLKINNPHSGYHSESPTFSSGVTHLFLCSLSIQTAHVASTRKQQHPYRRWTPFLSHTKKPPRTHFTTVCCCTNTCYVNKGRKDRPAVVSCPGGEQQLHWTEDWTSTAKAVDSSPSPPHNQRHHRGERRGERARRKGGKGATQTQRKLPVAPLECSLCLSCSHPFARAFCDSFYGLLPWSRSHSFVQANIRIAPAPCSQGKYDNVSVISRNVLKRGSARSYRRYPLGQLSTTYCTPTRKLQRSLSTCCLSKLVASLSLKCIQLGPSSSSWR